MKVTEELVEEEVASMDEVRIDPIAGFEVVDVVACKGNKIHLLSMEEGEEGNKVQSGRLSRAAPTFYGRGVDKVEALCRVPYGGNSTKEAQPSYFRCLASWWVPL